MHDTRHTQRTFAEGKGDYGRNVVIREERERESILKHIRSHTQNTPNPFAGRGHGQVSETESRTHIFPETLIELIHSRAHYTHTFAG